MNVNPHVYVNISERYTLVVTIMKFHALDN